MSNLDDRIFEAMAKSDNLPLVSNFITRANVDAVHSRTGSNILHKAAYYGRNEVVRWLLGNGASIDTTDENGNTPLYCASVNGHSAVAEMLIRSGADVMKANNDGLSPLHFAAGNGHIVVAKMLICNGADVNKMDHAGRMPLHFAAGNGCTAAVQLLINNDADVNKADNMGLTPLDVTQIDIIHQLLHSAIEAQKKTTLQTGELAVLREANGQLSREMDMSIIEKNSQTASKEKRCRSAQRTAQVGKDKEDEELQSEPREKKRPAVSPVALVKRERLEKSRDNVADLNAVAVPVLLRPPLAPAPAPPVMAAEQWNWVPHPHAIIVGNRVTKDNGSHDWNCELVGTARWNRGVHEFSVTLSGGSTRGGVAFGFVRFDNQHGGQFAVNIQRANRRRAIYLHTDSGCVTVHEHAGNKPKPLGDAPFIEGRSIIVQIDLDRRTVSFDGVVVADNQQLLTMQDGGWWAPYLSFYHVNYEVHVNNKRGHP